jgi:post-segregation antitoxin (ccd killing protein)
MVVRTMVVVLAMVGVARADDQIFRCPAAEAPATPAQPTADDARWPLFAKVVPRSRGCLDGEVIGVLVAYSGRVQAAIGSDGVYELVKDKEEPVYKLGVGWNRLRQAQLPAPEGVDETIMLDGNGQNVILRTDEVKLSQGKAHKLVADAHLVKLRVNAGRGSGPKEFAFHGDAIEILDRTKAYPLDVSRLIHGTLEQFASERRGKQWRDQLNKATADAVRADKEVPNVSAYKQRDEHLGGTYFATWMPETKTLRVTFYGRFTRELRKPLPQAAGAKKKQIELRTYAAEFAYEADFDAAGKRVSVKKHPVMVLPARIETESSY